MEERLRKIESRVEALAEGVLFTKGKALGLEAALLTLAREWGNEPQAVIEALHEVMERLDDPAKNPPTLAGSEKKEALRVVEQVSSALHSRNR